VNTYESKYGIQFIKDQYLSYNQSVVLRIIVITIGYNIIVHNF